MDSDTIQLAQGSKRPRFGQWVWQRRFKVLTIQKVAKPRESDFETKCLET